MDAEPLFSAFLCDHVAPRKSPMTLAAYASDLKHVRSFLSDRPGPLDIATLDEYLKSLRAYGYAPATIERRLQVLSCCLQWAARRDLFGPNPFLLWEIPRAPERAPRPLSPDEDARLLALLPALAARLHVAVRLGRFAGLRVGEAAALAWNDVQWNQNMLVVRNGKGGQDAHIPMPPLNLTTPLEQWWYMQGCPVDGRVVGLARQSLMRHARRLFLRLGIRHARFHVLRATYATRLAESGVHPMVIQRLLRHARLDTTMRYVAVSDDWRRIAVDTLDRSPEEAGVGL